MLRRIEKANSSDLKVLGMTRIEGQWIVVYPAAAATGSSTVASLKNFAASSGGVGLI